VVWWCLGARAGPKRGVYGARRSTFGDFWSFLMKFVREFKYKILLKLYVCIVSDEGGSSGKHTTIFQVPTNMTYTGNTCLV
jgi:hypothetical protein